eukprot:jgi/Psemu1/34401/gm1.34401_g
MPTTPVDWTPIFGIEFRFTSASNPSAAASLNKAYSEIIGKDELSEFFVTRKQEGPLEIAPDPQLHILNCVAKTIAINLIDPDEVTKGHIANLLSKCVIKHVTNNDGPTKRMHYTTEFDAAAKHAIHTNTDEEPTVLIELTITHWRFKPNWNASLFNKIYEDKSVIPPSSPVVSETLPVPSHPTIVPSGTTTLVHTKPTVSNPIKTPSNSTAPNASRYTWTWPYSPNSDSVSFRRVQSDTVPFQHAFSSGSRPARHQDKSPPVTAPSVTPSASTRSGHHSAPPWESANFRWKFNPQNETVVFHRLQKPAPVPLKPSLRLPLPESIPEGPVLASPIHGKHSAYTSPFGYETYSNPNPTVFRITKRHCDALTVKMYHLHANILSMNWFYDTLD